MEIICKLIPNPVDSCFNPISTGFLINLVFFLHTGRYFPHEDRNGAIAVQEKFCSYNILHAIVEGAYIYCKQWTRLWFISINRILYENRNLSCPVSLPKAQIFFPIKFIIISQPFFIMVVLYPLSILWFVMVDGQKCTIHNSQVLFIRDYYTIKV